MSIANICFRYPEKYGAIKKNHLSLALNLWKIDRKESIQLSHEKNIFSFLITRHPFERILSAFRFKNWTTTPAIKRFMKEKQTEDLSFKLFIEFLVETPVRLFDIHWMPIYLTCKPCLVDYKFIGNTDTMKEDSEKIRKKIGVKRSLPLDHVQPSGNSKTKIHKFYSDFDKKLLDKLYNIYEMDFILFGYSPDEYYEIVQT